MAASFWKRGRCGLISTVSGNGNGHTPRRRAVLVKSDSGAGPGDRYEMCDMVKACA